ncbi:MAG: peptidylprolyl isomerase [Myxococcota bacterium]
MGAWANDGGGRCRGNAAPRRVLLIALSCAAFACTPSADDPPADETSTTPSDGTDETGETMPLVEVQTTAGNLVLELRPDLAPKTVANFLRYAEDGFYDGTDGKGATILHRVVPGFVVQGGGLTEDLDSKETMDPVPNEANELLNLRGTVAMALVPGDVDSATSQFFINVTDNPELDAQPAFTVFATVALGLETVDEMSAVPTQSDGPYDDVPVDAIVIERVNVP